jgi:hypothetical protein
MQLTTVRAPSPTVARTGNLSLVLSSETVVLNGAIGATDKLDITVAVPFIKVKMEGLSWVETADGNVVLRATGAGSSSGLGDIAVGAKFRLKALGEGQPDPGGFALLVSARLPTGSTENFRGLGVTRTLGAVVFSAGRGKLRPHFNGGYEWWSDGVSVVTNRVGGRATARDQIVWAAGLEFEAAPKLTLLADVLGRNVLRGGRVDYATETPPPNELGVTSVEALVTLTKGVRKITLVPGLKWNLKGSFVLAANALIPMFDDGLHDRFTPVVGLDFSF